MSSLVAITLCVLFNALSLYANSVDAAQAKHRPVQRGGSVGNTVSGGSAQSQHQWSADPERGWVRRDEPDRENDRRAPTERHQPSRDRSKGKGKKF